MLFSWSKESFTDLLLVSLKVTFIILFCTFPSHKEFEVTWGWVSSQWASQKHPPIDENQLISQGPYNTLLPPSGWVYCLPGHHVWLWAFMFYLIQEISLWGIAVISHVSPLFPECIKHSHKRKCRSPQKYMLLPRWEDEEILVPSRLDFKPHVSIKWWTGDLHREN